MRPEKPRWWCERCQLFVSASRCGFCGARKPREKRSSPPQDATQTPIDGPGRDAKEESG